MKEGDLNKEEVLVFLFRNEAGEKREIRLGQEESRVDTTQKCMLL